MVELIPSKDVRAYAEEVGWEFSDLDKAALVHHYGLPVRKELAALEELKGELSDDGVIAQIDAYLAEQEELLRLAGQADGCVYMVLAREDDDKAEWPHGHFADLASAVEFGRRLELEFGIEKHQLLGEGLPLPARYPGMFNPNLMPEATFEELLVEHDDPDDIWMNAERVRLNYDAQGELLSFYSTEGRRPESREDVEREFDTANFQNAYVTLPNPFNAGDVVRWLGPGKLATSTIGIVEVSQDQWKEYEKRQRTQFAGVADFSDAQITVSFWDESGGFSHSHVPPTSLERYEVPEGDPAWHAIMCASDILVGYGGLDWFLLYLDKYREEHRKA